MLRLVLARLARRAALALIRRPWRLVVGLLLVAGLGVYWLWQDFPLRPGTTSLVGARELTVSDLRAAGDQVLMVLKEKSGDRALVMGIGVLEARAIYTEMQGIKPPRPGTYELMRSLIQQMGGKVEHVIVTQFSENAYYAKVVVSQDGKQIELDSRPSDAIALALRAKAPIYANASVLDQMGTQVPSG